MSSCWKVIDSYTEDSVTTTTEAMDAAEGVLVRVTILIKNMYDNSYSSSVTMSHISAIEVVRCKSDKSKYEYKLKY